jgi:hypothetical protein
MDILKQYRDRSYINSLLCDLSHNFYNAINNILIFPTILGSSILTVLNSSEIDTDKMKITNIIINGTITIILAISNTYKIHDRIGFFKIANNKFIKLTHEIEAVLNLKKEINNEELVTFINKYDILVDELVFTFPEHIRNKIIKKYEKTNIILPNSLALDASIIVDIVNVV